MPTVARAGYRDGLHLWVIVPEAVRVLLESAPTVHPPPLSLGVAKHTNLTGGAPACCGGELWLDAVDPQRIYANGGSGRFTAKSPAHLEDAMSVIESLGFNVVSAGWDIENDRLLDAVFGPGEGPTAAARAVGSTQGFIREYEAVARVLGLDERLISFRADRSGNERLAVRLRRLADDRDALQPSGVVALAEASWVAMTQLRLEAKLGLGTSRHSFDVSSDYGGRWRPAYEVGYELADQVRSVLELGVEPVASMRDLVERRLAVPVIQAPLGERIAGATVRSDTGRRAIVLNIQGKNADASVRRSTLAHELCHLLFDPDEHLLDLRVDEYAELESRADLRTDRVEQRANAFAVQFLAPQHEAVRRYEAGDNQALRLVLDAFGISFTAGRYQIWNGLQRSMPLETIVAPNRRPQVDWEGREGYTLAFHPIRPLVDHPARAGRFSAVVVAAAERAIVSWDTAASLLCCSEGEIKAGIDDMHGLFPDVFAIDPAMVNVLPARAEMPG